MTDLNNRVTRYRRKGQGGFTLIELLVVIAILSVLAAIVVINVTGVKTKGNTAACVTDAATVQTAVDEYVAAQVNGGLGGFTFGTNPATKVAIDSVESTLQNTPTGPNDLVPNYLNSAPTSCSSAAKPWGNIQVALNAGGDIVVSGAYS
jgi:prepilin-type N-terminal cleavage/methylation domain-containing protein